jgi:hypothetical protein
MRVLKRRKSHKRIRRHRERRNCSKSSKSSEVFHSHSQLKLDSISLKKLRLSRKNQKL